MRRRIRANKIAALCVLVLPAFAASPAGGPPSIGATDDMWGVGDSNNGSFDRNEMNNLPPSGAGRLPVGSSNTARFLTIAPAGDVSDFAYRDTTGMGEVNNRNSSGSEDGGSSDTVGFNGTSPFSRQIFGGTANFGSGNGQSGEEPPAAGNLGQSSSSSSPEPALSSGESAPNPNNGSGTVYPTTNDLSTNNGPPQAKDPPPSIDPPVEVPEPLTLSFFALGFATAIALRHRHKGA